MITEIYHGLDEAQRMELRTAAGIIKGTQFASHTLSEVDRQVGGVADQFAHGSCSAEEMKLTAIRAVLCREFIRELLAIASLEE